MAFAAELKQQEIKMEAADPELELRCRIQRVNLHAYGKGTMEGLGSAGDYWEVALFLEELELWVGATGQVLGV